MGGDFFSIEVIKLKKIFFTDIDGTLLNDKKELTPETRKVIEKISEAGHYMVLASGRPMMSVMEESSLEFPIITCIILEVMVGL